MTKVQTLLTPVGSHSIPDLRIESKQELSGFALMTSRTPFSLETGFSGVLFIENWIFGSVPLSSARYPGNMVALHDLTKRASDPTSARLPFGSGIQAQAIAVRGSKAALPVQPDF